MRGLKVLLAGVFIYLALLGSRAFAGWEDWASIYNGPGDSIDLAIAIAVEGLGNVYVTGRSGSSTTGMDYATVKYDPNGTQLWAARYNGSTNYDDWPSGITMDIDGNVYIAGTSKVSLSVWECVTVKYDPNGNQIWAALYSRPGYPFNWVSAQTGDGLGNVYVTGGSSYIGIPGYGPDDYLTLKYNPDGTLLWAVPYNNPEDTSDIAKAIAVDADGNVYVTGSSQGATPTSYYFTTIKYNSSGSQLWVSQFDGPVVNGDDQPTAIAIDTSGNVYVTGFSEGISEGLETGLDYVVIKYDTNGNQLWAARYTSPANYPDVPSAITVDSSGNVYVTGYRSLGSQYYFDDTTIKYDTNGNQLWVAGYNDPAGYSDAGTAITVDALNNVYVAGTLYNNSMPNSDYFTIKYDPDGNHVWETSYDGLAGQSPPGAAAITLDYLGNVYVTGSLLTGTSFSDYVTLKYPDSPYGSYVNPATEQDAWYILHDNSLASLINSALGNGYKDFIGVFQTCFAGGFADKTISKLNGPVATLSACPVREKAFFTEGTGGYGYFAVALTNEAIAANPTNTNIKQLFDIAAAADMKDEHEQYKDKPQNCGINNPITIHDGSGVLDNSVFIFVGDPSLHPDWADWNDALQFYWTLRVKHHYDPTDIFFLYGVGLKPGPGPTPTYVDGMASYANLQLYLSQWLAPRMDNDSQCLLYIGGHAGLSKKIQSSWLQMLSGGLLDDVATLNFDLDSQFLQDITAPEIDLETNNVISGNNTVYLNGYFLGNLSYTGYGVDGYDRFNVSPGILSSNNVLQITSYQPATLSVGNIYCLTGVVPPPAADPDIYIQLIPDSSTVYPGGTLSYVLTLHNNTNTTQTFQFWSEAYLPNNSIYPLIPSTQVTLTPGQTIQPRFRLRVPQGAPIGEYAYAGKIGAYPLADLGANFFDFAVSGQTQSQDGKDNTGGTDWQVIDGDISGE